MLYIRTFGGCHVERDGVRLDELSGQRRALALLALLATAGPSGISRESVTALLWPDSDDARARSSLKQLVRSIRKDLCLPDLLLGGAELRLNPVRAATDVGEFRDAIERRDYDAAVAVYGGSFLSGFRLRRAEEFERWTDEVRASLAREFARALEMVAEEAGRRGDTRRSVDAWQRLARAEPLDARAAVGLMRALDAAGEQSAALRHGRAFQSLIRAELGTDADPSVAELVARLLRHSPNGGSSAAARVDAVDDQSATGASVPMRTLAVLPFANTSGDDSDDHFSDGLTDELIGTIGKIDGLTVTGRTSSFAFKGKAIDFRAVAESLHVGVVLEGSVRRAGDRLKIGAQLVRVDDGAVMWSEIYDRDAQDIFAVQEEIARSIAGALRVRLAPSDAARTRVSTGDLVAHELYLKGQYFQNRVTVEDLRRAAGYFDQAIARDPSFARAHVGLADAYLLLTVLEGGREEHNIARAREALSRALALGNTLAEAHTSLASMLFAFDWDWTAAARAFERAVALDAAYGLAHPRYGLFLMYQGRLGQAQEVLERARTVDPLAPSSNMNLGRLHVSAGRPEVAVPLLEAAVELNPRLAIAHEHLGYAYLQLGRHDEALAAFRVVASVDGARGATRLAYALAMTGHEREARHITDTQLQSATGDPLPTFGLAIAYAGLDEPAAAFHWLERAYAERDVFLHTVKATPAFRALHPDARWGKLLRRMGLSP